MNKRTPKIIVAKQEITTHIRPIGFHDIVCSCVLALKIKNTIGAIAEYTYDFIIWEVNNETYLVH